MGKIICIDSFGGNVYAALAENGKLLEFHIEKAGNKKIVGNIYKGRVENVLNGMQAAFVNVGLEKNGYLYAGDLPMDKSELASGVGELPKLNLKAGQEIMVQAVKAPFGTKGARLSAVVSIAGRNLVYLPNFDFIGISRKIEDEKTREKLTAVIQKFKPQGAGFILRTAGAEASKKELTQEAEVLKKLYAETEENYRNAKPGDVVYTEGDLPTRLVRDINNKDIARVVVADEEIYRRLKTEAQKRKSDFFGKIELFSEPVDVFQKLGLSAEIDKLLRNRVELKSGAYLVIDKTEALTAIDVNTGKYVGDKSLEQTVFETNMEAAREIARQVRLRNIGGIVIVDFIDMESEEHRSAVVDELTVALKTDRVKCNVLGMTALGLVEFTRKKMRKESTSLLLKPCPYCKGDGRVFADDYVIMKLRTALLDLFHDGYAAAIVDLNENIANQVLNQSEIQKDAQYFAGKRVYLIPHKTYHNEYFRVRGDNSVVLDLPDNAIPLY